MQITSSLAPKEIIPDMSSGQDPSSREQTSRGRRRFAILLDYRNLRYSLQEERDVLRELKELEKYILTLGTIEFAYAYVPHHEINIVPIQQLHHTLQYKVVACPIRVSQGVIKDADTVDATLDREARALIERTDITDIVIISGDADFFALTVFAERKQKKVMVVSGILALSHRYRELDPENITIREIRGEEEQD